MPAHDSLPAIQQAIQLSIAPVFLLTGVAALLGVMANRLARIIDRARDLERKWNDFEGAGAEAARRELVSLERRRSLASWAINLCTGAALLICLVIVTLFVGEFVQTDLTLIAGAQFVGAMVFLIGGLSAFLAEVYIATHTSRIQAATFQRRPPAGRNAGSDA